MQIQEVDKLNEEQREEEPNRKKQFIIEVILMIAVGTMVLLPFSLYVYHFFL